MAPNVRFSEIIEVSKWVHTIQSKRHMKRADRKGSNLRIDVILTQAIYQAQNHLQKLYSMSADENLRLEKMKSDLIHHYSQINKIEVNKMKKKSDPLEEEFNNFLDELSKEYNHLVNLQNREV